MKLVDGLLVPDVEVVPNPLEMAKGRMSFRIEVSWETLSRIVSKMYAEGRSHEYVTRYLETSCPTFRDVMIEQYTGEGVARWVLRPSCVAASSR